MNHKFWFAFGILAGIAIGADWKSAVAWAHPNHEGSGTASHARPFVVLKGLPADPTAYNDAAAELVRIGIPNKYGDEEWASVVLTHEFHQHVGVYTIVGAKMGVRAREELGAPMRAVEVTMECGNKQPMSCVADGVQVALGSTLAQNLISLPNLGSPSVSAVFRYKDKVVRIKLKPDYQATINGWIEKAMKEHPGFTPEYFKAVEKSSYDAWMAFDRKDMFEVSAV